MVRDKDHKQVKAKVRGYTRRFLQALKDEDLDIHVQKLGPRYAGFCLGNHIYIDHTASAFESLLSVFIHELLHYLNPERREKEVERVEKIWMQHSSWKQKKALLLELCELAKGR